MLSSRQRAIRLARQTCFLPETSAGQNLPTAQRQTGNPAALRGRLLQVRRRLDTDQKRARLEDWLGNGQDGMPPPRRLIGLDVPEKQPRPDPVSGLLRGPLPLLAGHCPNPVSHCAARVRHSYRTSPVSQTDIIQRRRHDASVCGLRPCPERHRARRRHGDARAGRGIAARARGHLPDQLRPVHLRSPTCRAGTRAGLTLRSARPARTRSRAQAKCWRSRSRAAAPRATAPKTPNRNRTASTASPGCSRDPPPTGPAPSPVSS